MAKALIDGRIDCKTAGQMVVHLQTMSKLLWLLNKNNGILPRMNADHTAQKELKAKSVKAANAKKDLAANEREKARTLVMEARECGDRGWRISCRKQEQREIKLKANASAKEGAG